MSVATKTYIDNLRENRWEIDETLESHILAKCSEEPYPHVWSDQDLHEQVRKLVNDYDAKLPPNPDPIF